MFHSQREGRGTAAVTEITQENERTGGITEEKGGTEKILLVGITQKQRKGASP
jgi:hypothetical protein